jgi:membrane protease YdiL (CAAX protease family)
VFRSAVSFSIALSLLACGPPMRPARTSPEAPASPAEIAASKRIARADCGPALGLLLPGVAQLCQGRTAEGATMMTLALAEVGTGVAVGLGQEEGLEGFSHPGAAIPLLAAQNLWLYAYADATFEEQRAQQALYVPLDTPAELALAPFNASVIGEPDVWIGTLVSTAIGIAVSAAIGEPLDTDHLGEDANLFGQQFDPALGYPLGGAVGAGLFSHVAVGEESIFRGLLQSGMAREADPTTGWIGSSIVFGAAHAPNALALPQNRREAYLLIGVPTITLLGTYLGASYRRHDYSLAAPVAIHFWYNFLLSATFFALDPQDSPLAASVALPF